MKIGRYILLLTWFCLAFGATPFVRADSEESKEYHIKAAFLYNFIKFIDWPKEKIADSNSITIGIIGENPFGKAFEALKDKKVKDKKVLIKQFQSVEEMKLPSEQIEAIRKCHVLFVCRSEVKYLRRIMDCVKDHSVLAVGDMANCLESGVIINFIKEDKKVRFEINNREAKKANLDIRSKLLRLAKKVIDERASNGAKN